MANIFDVPMHNKSLCLRDLAILREPTARTHTQFLAAPRRLRTASDHAVRGSLTLKLKRRRWTEGSGTDLDHGGSAGGGGWWWLGEGTEYATAVVRIFMFVRT